MIERTFAIMPPRVFIGRFVRCCSLAAAISLLGCDQKDAPAPTAGGPTATPAAAPRESPVAVATPTPTPAARSTASPSPGGAAPTVPPTAAPSAPAPAAAVEGKLDLATLEALCKQADVPMPPGAERLPADLAGVVVAAVRRVVEAPGAESVGRLGCTYHAIARNREDTDAAKTCYEKAKALDPASYQWPYFLGRLFFARASLERARQEFETALRLNPDYPRTHFWLGELELNRQSGAEALPHYEAYIAREPEVVDGYVGAAAACLADKRLDQAYEFLQKALAVDTDCGWVHQVLGSYHLAKGDEETAAREMGMARSLPRLTGIVRNDPLELELWRSGGATRFTINQLHGWVTAGDADSAVRFGEALMADYPDDPAVLTGVARVYATIGRLEDATTIAKRARGGGDYPPAIVVLAQIAWQQRRFDDTLSLADQALARDDSIAMAHICRGQALASMDRLSEAQAAFERAVELEPNNTLSRKALGEVLHAQGKLDQAKAQYLTALEIGEKMETFPAALVPVLMTVANIERREGDVASAIRHLDRVVRLNPGREFAFQQLADLLVSVGRGEDAINYCRSLLKQNPQSLTYSITLADLLARTGKSAKGLELLDKLARQVPTSPDVLFARGGILQRDGKLADAEAAYAATVELEPKFERAYVVAGAMLLQEKNFAAALQWSRRGLEQLPDAPLLNNTTAWILATCPDAALRDPEQAVRLAEHANELASRDNANFLDTLACAYAAAGRFDDARRTAKQAVDIAAAQPDVPSLDDFRAHLALFEKDQPFLEAP